MPDLLYLEWGRAAHGYNIAEAAPDFFDIENDEEADESDMYLEMNDPEIVIYRPLEEYPALFMEFAYTEQTAEGVNAFADKFGLLWWKPGDRRGLDDELSIYDWLKRIRRVRAAVDFWQEGRERGSLGPLIEGFAQRTPASVEVVLQPVLDDPMRAALRLTPPDLDSAMWLQFAQAVSNNTQLRCCARCPTWFAYGTGTGRRGSANYCSAACRKAAWKAEKERKK